MTLQGIILVFLSAVMHASWNVYSKSYGNPLSFMYWALVWSAIIYVPLFVAAVVFAPFTPMVWLLAISSGLLCSVYFLALGLSYRDGLVSVAYPVARAFPILVVTWAGTLLGERPSVQGLVGIVLVVTGCFFLPFREFKRSTGGPFWRAYITRSALWAFAAAFVTSLYSIVDKAAAMHIRASQPGLTLLGKLNYVYIQNLIGLVGLVLVFRFLRWKMDPVPRAQGIVFGVIFLVSYGLVMVAFTTDPVAYVVTFRQLSIVIATIASMIFTEKFFSWPRFVGAVQITIGVVLVGLG
jgi:drug/metabolite transporter (DMT)-like permease